MLTNDDTVERVARAIFEATKPEINKNVGWETMLDGLNLGEEMKAVFRKQARAAISALQQWQPIETAPRDGTEVIVYDPTNRIKVFTASFLEHEWSASVENRWAPEDDFFGDSPKQPTLWMHKPAPPETGDG